MDYDYDVTVIGAGAAGLTASGVCASLGAKTALVEARKAGGDCTWYGCIPSKALLKSAATAHAIRTAETYGVKAGSCSIDFPAIMKRVHDIQQQVYDEADKPEIYENMGVRFIEGKASFLDEFTLQVRLPDGTDRTLRSKNFIIATGSSPYIPPVEGLDSVDYLTNETLFTLKQRPERLLVLGAGPIGIEMGQAFARFGSAVTVFDAASRILPNDHPDLTGILQKKLEEEGMTFRLGSTVTSVSGQDAVITVTAQESGTGKKIIAEGDALLVAAGRIANTGALQLDAAGIGTHQRGIAVNGSCQTSKRHIYACGDVTGGLQFTHVAEHMAKVAATNMLTRLPMSTDDRHIPWCTYCDPEMAHVGEREENLKQKRISYEVYRFPFSRIDRAITDNRTDGWIRIYAAGLDGKIYGADILGSHAGELISELALAMRNGITLRQMSDTVHPYPTYALGNRRAADQWYVRKQSGALVGLLQFFFGYQGKMPEKTDPDRIV
ncbi:NAD(P)/FAD-dependent oxidoreductase [Prosthecochloris sp. N3]|uniref:NAD(P)/FAD-dependent oxidoreductase n=1 Tax=Prosthecochloris ethylica TaxID=2743976 RepID=A0ABR9XUV1_9CHLB|nr:NAD(P)/FAD-dependent oxidoreductase [Prosthecochloris ethylica]MBF0587282.1 NAD(P)/FAD-dependent oxidoreductase [Prosthecochloris ethylica]MBF0637496.1 NAD(P)/FAD-dependent oxidoreductase [Prosthecochloris ethylica]NUK48090.1 NAD(P)/FAD-dependent oxidoreductase [Prosthecochloris ethylica]